MTKHRPLNWEETFCGTTAVTSILWNRKGPKCEKCQRYLTDEDREQAEKLLRQVLRRLIGNHRTSFADDWEDSTHATLIAAEAIEGRMPFLKLQPLGRRKRMFEIAQMMYRIETLDSLPPLPAPPEGEPDHNAFARMTYWHRQWNKTIDTNLTELIRIAAK